MEKPSQGADMKIALIHTPFWRRAGGERQILRLAIELQRLGHDPEIFTNAVNPDSYPEFFDKVKINVVPHPLTGRLPRSVAPQIAVTRISDTPTGELKHQSTPGIRRWVSNLVGRQYYTSELPAMFQLGRKVPEGFDVINNHNFPTEWAAYFAKSRLKAPVVWMCNEPPYWFFVPEHRKGLLKINWPLFELLDKISVSYIDQIMVLSHVSERYVKQAYGRGSRIVRTGVDAELFHNVSGINLRRKYGLENAFVMLFVGGSRYAFRKDLVKALQILAKKYDHIRLIIDTSREKDVLAKLSEDLGVRDKLLLLHSRTDAELAEVYAACDVFVYPSAASPWGLVVTEAMAAGKSVIVSKQVGTSEIISNNENGIIIETATPQEIATQVASLIENPKLRKKLGENAYLYVRDNLSWRNYAERVLRVFEETLRRSKT
jgi:glycosyltransferase involved in cell wall biosynthesis